MKCVAILRQRVGVRKARLVVLDDTGDVLALSAEYMLSADPKARFVQELSTCQLLLNAVQVAYGFRCEAIPTAEAESVVAFKLRHL